MEVHRPPALEAVGGGATGADSERSYRRSPRSQAGDGTSRSRRRRHSLTPSSHSQQRPALTEVLQSAQEMIVALRQQQARKRADERRSPAPGWQQQQQQQQHATFYTEETTVHHHSNHQRGTPRGSPHRTHDMMTSPIDDYQQQSQQQVGYSRHSSVDYVGGDAGVGSPVRRQSSSSVQLHCMESNIQILSPPVSPQRPLQVHEVSYQQTQQTKRAGSSQGSPRRARRSSVSTSAQTTPAPIEMRGRSGSSSGSGHGSTPPPALRSPYDDSHGDFNSTVPLLPNFEAAAAAACAAAEAHTLPSTPQRSVAGGGGDGGVRDSGTGPPTPRRDTSVEAEAAWLEDEAAADTGTDGVEDGGAVRRVERHDFFPSPQAMRAQERTVAHAQWEPPRPEWRYASERGGDGRAVTAMRAAANAARAERRREGQESGGGVECGVDMGVLYGRTDANALSTLEAGERYIMMKRAYVHYLAETAMGRPAELPAFCFVSSEKQYVGRQAGGSAASADLSAAVAASNSNDAHVVDDPASEHGSGGGGGGGGAEDESAAPTLRCAARSGSSGDTAAAARTPSEDAVATQHSADSYTDMLLPGRGGGPAGWRESRVEDELRVLDRRLSALRGKSAAAAIAGMPGKPLTYLELFRRWGVCHQTRPGGGRHAIAGRGGGGGAGGGLGGLMGLRRDASSTWSAESEVVAELGLEFPSLVGFARAKNGR